MSLNPSDGVEANEPPNWSELAEGTECPTLLRAIVREAQNEARDLHRQAGTPIRNPAEILNSMGRARLGFDLLAFKIRADNARRRNSWVRRLLLLLGLYAAPTK